MLGRGTTIFSGSRVFDKDTGQRVATKYVDAHRAQCAAWLAWLLLKRVYLSLRIRFQNAKAGAFLDRYDHSPKGDIGVALLVERDHRPVVHTINMVASEDDDIVVTLLHNEVKILVDGVGGTLVPFRLLMADVWLEHMNAAFLAV